MWSLLYFESAICSCGGIICPVRTAVDWEVKKRIHDVIRIIMYNPQLLYNRNMAKGSGIYKTNSIDRLIKDGIDDNMWPENYKIVGAKSDYKDFIEDKVKKMLLRKRATEEKRRLQE